MRGRQPNFATLEQQVAELRENLLRTREAWPSVSARSREAQSSRKPSGSKHWPRTRTIFVRSAKLQTGRGAATDFLAALDAYDDETPQSAAPARKCGRRSGATSGSPRSSRQFRTSRTAPRNLGGGNGRHEVAAEARSRRCGEKTCPGSAGLAQERRRARIRVLREELIGRRRFVANRLLHAASRGACYIGSRRGYSSAGESAWIAPRGRRFEPG